MRGSHSHTGDIASGRRCEVWIRLRGPVFLRHGLRRYPGHQKTNQRIPDGHPAIERRWTNHRKFHEEYRPDPVYIAGRVFVYVESSVLDRNECVFNEKNNMYVGFNSYSFF